MIKTFFSNPKVRLALISFLSALFIAYIFLLPHNQGAFRAIPSQTSVLLEFNGLVKAGKQIHERSDETWKAVLNTTLFQNCWSVIGTVEPLFHHDAGARASFAGNKLLAAYSLHPADSLQALFILELDGDFPLRKTLETDPLKHKYFPYQFHSQTLFTVHLSQNDRIVVAQKGRLLIFSRYSYLVEDAMTQLESARGWWADNKYLSDVDEAACLRLFFRPSKWQAQHEGSLLPEARPIATTISANLDWVGFAWDGQKTTAICGPNGFLAGIGAWNGSRRKDIYQVLPENTAMLAWAGFDNQSLFFKELADKQSVDFERFILPWAGNEAAIVVTEPLSEALSDDRLLFIAVRDSAKAQQALESYGQNRGMIAHEPVGMFDIFGFQSRSLLSPFFSETDMAFQNPYFAHLGKYVVVAPNRASIEVFLEKYIGNQTLAQNVDFLQLQQQLGHDGRGLLVLNGGYLSRILHQLFQKTVAQKAWQSDIQPISKIGWIAAEIEPSLGKKIDLNFSIQPQSVGLPTSNVFWKTTLGAPAATRAFTIPQPGMPMGVAILVQDNQSQLYCLQPDGTMAWQKPIGDMILSNISGIDYFQNGRNCYVFNTKSKVWIIDENGQEVQGYPLPLKAPACTGLTIVNFDKNLKFNYFVCCENGNIYGFDLFGRALDGWNPQSDVGKAAGEMLHFQHNGKDYLAMLNSQGQLSVFGRDGKLRFPPVALAGDFAAPPFLDKSRGKPRIVCVNQMGVVFSCDLEGKYSEQTWTGKNSEAPLQITPVEIEGMAAFSVLQGKQLTVLKLSSGNFIQKVFSVQCNALQDAVFSTGSGVGLWASKARKITLVDNTGKTAQGFPIPGSTPFGLCYLGKQKLLVGGNGSAVFAYKLDE